MPTTSSVQLIAVCALLQVFSAPCCFGGAFGSIYGPDDAANANPIKHSGLKVRCHRYDGTTRFDISFDPLENFRSHDWISQLVVWKARDMAKVDVVTESKMSGEGNLAASFVISDERIADADFGFQAHKDGNPGLYCELDLVAFMEATEGTAVFPADEE